MGLKSERFGVLLCVMVLDRHLSLFQFCILSDNVYSRKRRKNQCKVIKNTIYRNRRTSHYKSLSYEATIAKNVEAAYVCFFCYKMAEV